MTKSAKHSRKSTTHESKREEKKKGGDDGECVGRKRFTDTRDKVCDDEAI